MSHEFESGLFTNNKKAWHGLGNVVEEKIYSTTEAIKLAGLDWSVVKEPVYIFNPDGTKTLVENVNAVVRDSDRTILGSVSDRYELLQNKDAFSFFEPFLHEKDVYISSAISLFNGRKIVICAQIEDNTREIVKNDPIRGHLILATSHDGSLGTIVKFTDVRVVCNNTLRAALSSKGEFRSVKHSKKQKEKLVDIQTSINLYKADFEENVNLYKQMANRQMGVNDFRDYLEKVFASELKAAAKRAEVEEEKFRLENYRPTAKILDNYKFTPDLQLEGIAGTSWAGFNAITEYVSHQKGNDSEKRFNSVIFGTDAELLNRAKQFALI